MRKDVLHSIRIPTLAAAALCLIALAGCQVRPLYSQGPSLGAGESAGMADQLSSISIKPVSTRYGQEVRNHLIFMFGRGAGEPASPRYSLTLSIASSRETATYRQAEDSGTDLEPTAATMTLTADYQLSSFGDNTVIARGKRQVTSSFDVPRQSFAEMRAERDAQNRAARELAELLRLAIAQDLSRR